MGRWENVKMGKSDDVKMGKWEDGNENVETYGLGGIRNGQIEGV